MEANDGMMNITITDKLTLLAVQQEFNRIFPYLKINFFTFTSRGTGILHRKLLDKCVRPFGDFRAAGTLHNFVISPLMTVFDLERQFNKEYGLSVQIYRNSGGIWLETNATDSWTLEEQNRQGQMLSKQP